MSWQFLKNFFGEGGAVVAELRKLYELYEISLGVVAFGVDHFAVIVIELLHDLELALADAHDDHRDGERVAFDEQVDHFCLVVDLPVGQDEQDHVMRPHAFVVPALVHGLLHELCELGGA